MKYRLWMNNISGGAGTNKTTKTESQATDVIQRRYFILVPERLIFYSLLLLWIVLTTVIPRFHG